MDVLSDVFQAVRLTGAVFFDVRACEPVVAATPHMKDIGRLVMPRAQHVIPFHIMLRGSCWVESIDGDEPPAPFSEGDIVIYPHGHGHVFVTELNMYLQYWKNKKTELQETMTDKQEKYLQSFWQNLQQGIAYYKELVPTLFKDQLEKRVLMLDELLEAEDQLQLANQKV